MTALCGGGTSAPKLATAAVVDYSAGILAAIFAAYDLTWLIPVIPLVGLLPLSVNTFCASDPPAVPTFTQAEVDAVLQLTLGADFDNGIAKVKDLILNAIWHDACECSGGTPTPDLVPPTQPSGSITVVFPRNPIVAPCVVYPYGAVSFSQGSGLNRLGPSTVGAVITSLVLTVTNTLTSGTFVPVNYRIEGLDASSAIIFDKTVRQTVAGTQSFTLAVSPTAIASWNIQVTLDATPTGTESISMLLDLYCNGDVPGAPQTPCCPPDPATAATLTHILDLVRSMQRNYAPFGYIRGTSHAAISGTGSFVVSRQLGLEIQVDSYPGDKQVLLGNPPYVKDLGWVSVSEADGMIQERRVAQTQFTWFPQLMPIATQVNYALQNGVTCTITELAPEP